jgi:hypothetical protein
MLEGVLLLVLQKLVSIVNDGIALAEIPEIGTMGLGCPPSCISWAVFSLLHFLGGLFVIDIVTLATLLEPRVDLGE